MIVICVFNIKPYSVFKEHTCQTEDGWGPCVFPFKYKDKTYEACTTVGKGGFHKKPWCAYKVDATGKMVSRKWADCIMEKGCELG